MSSGNERAEFQVAHQKVSVIVELHPLDDENARAAAERQGVDYNEFCALAIHRAVLEAGKNQ